MYAKDDNAICTIPAARRWSEQGGLGELSPELGAEYRDALGRLSEKLAAGEDLRPTIKLLTDLQAVWASDLLPFRLYRTWQELGAAPRGSFGMRRKRAKVQTALVQAMTIACDNAGHLEGGTALLVDTSRTMAAPLASNPTTTCSEVAAVLVATLSRISDDSWACALDMPARQLLFCGCNVVKDAGSIPFTGATPNVAAGFELLRASGFDARRVMVISDGKMVGDAWPDVKRSPQMQTIADQVETYATQVGHEVWCHVFDLQGQDVRQHVSGQMNAMAGWSEELLRTLAHVEEGTS